MSTSVRRGTRHRKLSRKVREISTTKSGGISTTKSGGLSIVRRGTKSGTRHRQISRKVRARKKIVSTISKTKQPCMKKAKKASTTSTTPTASTTALDWDPDMDPALHMDQKLDLDLSFLDSDLPDLPDLDLLGLLGVVSQPLEDPQAGFPSALDFDIDFDPSTGLDFDPSTGLDFATWSPSTALDFDPRSPSTGLDFDPQTITTITP
jgi:hypothetical protein